MEENEIKPIQQIEGTDKKQYQGCFFKTAITGCFSLVILLFLWGFFVVLGFIFFKR